MIEETKLWFNKKLNGLFCPVHGAGVAVCNCKTPPVETEAKWECPYCGREMKGRDVFPNEACCGEAGHAVKVDET